MIPEATSGITCGRKITVVATEPNRVEAIRWMRLAVTTPSVTRMTLKKIRSRNELKIGPNRSESVNTRT